jgi:hypothetical protein
MEEEEQQDVIWCRFCALYLPDLVGRYLDPPAVTALPDVQQIADFRCFNAYLEMLVAIQHTPYFAKYLRSRKPIALQGKLLPSVLAERLLERAPRWDRLMLQQPDNMPPYYYKSITASAVQLLSTLLTSFVKEPDQEKVVPRATRRALLPWLQKWYRRYPVHNPGPTVLGDVSMRVWAQMSEEMDITGAVKGVRKALRNWEMCALPSCDSKSNNKACAKYVRLSLLASESSGQLLFRCQTVCYVGPIVHVNVRGSLNCSILQCSPEHQKLHWKFPFGAQHKQLCHATQY